MSCAGCVSSVEKALGRVPGVASASVNFAEHTAAVEGEVDADALIEAVSAAGYEAAELQSLDDGTEQEAEDHAQFVTLLRQAGVAAVVGVPQFVFGMAGWLPDLDSAAGRLFWLLVGAATLFVLWYSGGHFFSGALKSARNHTCLLYTSDAADDYLTV